MVTGPFVVFKKIFFTFLIVVFKDTSSIVYSVKTHKYNAPLPQ